MTRKKEWIGLKNAEKYHVFFKQLEYADRGTGLFNQLLKKSGVVTVNNTFSPGCYSCHPEKYDLAITNTSMPQMNWIYLTRKIFSASPDILPSSQAIARALMFELRCSTVTPLNTPSTRSCETPVLKTTHKLTKLYVMLQKCKHLPAIPALSFRGSS